VNINFKTKKDGCPRQQWRSQILEDSKEVQDWREEVVVCLPILFLVSKLLKHYNSPYSLTNPIVT